MSLLPRFNLLTSTPPRHGARFLCRLHSSPPRSFQLAIQTLPGRKQGFFSVLLEEMAHGLSLARARRRTEEVAALRYAGEVAGAHAGHGRRSDCVRVQLVCASATVPAPSGGGALRRDDLRMLLGGVVAPLLPSSCAARRNDMRMLLGGAVAPSLLCSFFL